jgi:NADH-quinone oxidoreductase subunit C
MKNELTEFLKDKFSDELISVNEFRGTVSYRVQPEALVTICKALHDSTEFAAKYLAEISCVDWLAHENEKDGRFEVIYVLYSYKANYRFILNVRVDADKPNVPSLTKIWKGANWLEREAFDLFGINFEGHPNLSKIVTPDELEGHPLRKDFPLTWEQPHFSWNKDQPPEVIK